MKFAYSIENPMELFQLEAFLAVVREGSFSAAAKALYRTQPAISQTIKKLEDEIGRPLFDRSSRRGLLTDAGRVLADHAERLVNLRQRTLAALDDVRQLQDGTAAGGGQRADVPLPVTDPARIPAALPRSAHHGAAGPRQPRAGAGARLRRRLRRDHLPARHRGAALDVVYHDELAFVVPPSHPLARRAKVSIAELASESFVAHHVSSPYRQKVIDTFRKRRIELRMPVEMPTIDAIKKFVAMGNGVALLPAITRGARAGAQRAGARAGARAGVRSQAALDSPPRRHAVACRRSDAVGGRSAERAQEGKVCVRRGTVAYT